MIRCAICLLLALSLQAGEFNIVWDGSSSTGGTGFRPAVDTTLRNLGHTVVSINRAVSGRSMGAYAPGCEGSWTQVCRAGELVDPNLNAAPGVQVYWSQNPTNDMASGTSGENGYARHLDLIARRAAGWVHIVMTATPRTNDGYNPRRNVYNGLIRAGCLEPVQLYANDFDGAAYRCGDGSPFHYLVDAASDTRFGDDEDAWDTTWIPDGVHPSSAGYAVIRDMAVAVMKDALAPALLGMFPMPNRVRW
jgi:lysophospholipase L1-like esterase